ncbi:CBS domain-containing protein [Megalodesulfovibrio gigas]|uniref:Putative CBS domain containing membrane protein n=1 Tax=Megalodesulfovibrio gigas (strain ATCC 19364 / DSM 1382 / NCIMB 9332 / VKM B-1759) TaxID=1121448 RepID=T2GBM6_MEGG1|nr:CBS domain-containing protein [Megalodesulfovibrio gigas]AGW13995.1 putative CBS domain containing membrane protein [Megalodesulfovibrio gigas DSM 1382 = ATCC 19364]
MYVGLKMLTRDQFVTITPKTLVHDAEKLMLANRLWMLLVVDDGKLVGHVRKEDVKEALPSRATSLSRHELNYLLAKLDVAQIMRTDTPTIEPEAEIEVAAQKMFDEDLPGLAVVGCKNRLLGYINRNLMLGVLVEEMGLEQGGARIAFEVEDRSGVIYEVAGIIKGYGGSIISTSTFYHNGRRMVVLRVHAEDPAAIAKDIEAAGYIMVGPHTFESDWCNL